MSDPSADIWIDDKDTDLNTTASVTNLNVGQSYKITLKNQLYKNFNWNWTVNKTEQLFDVDLAPGNGEFWPEPVEDANIRVKGDLSVAKDFYGNWKCEGELMNYGGRWAGWIKISFSLYDKDGNIIGSDSTYCDGTCGAMNYGLKPGETAAFTLLTFKSYNQVSRYEYNITWETRG